MPCAISNATSTSPKPGLTARSNHFVQSAGGCGEKSAFLRFPPGQLQPLHRLFARPENAHRLVGLRLRKPACSGRHPTQPVGWRSAFAAIASFVAHTGDIHACGKFSQFGDPFP